MFKPNKDFIIYEGEKSRQIYNEEEVTVNTLDNNLKNYKDKIDLIKIDTQGSEYEILEGGLERIKNDKPFIFLETWSSPHYENIKYIDEILNLLRKINYEIYLMDLASSVRLDFQNRFKENFGSRKHTGFNIFIGPSLKTLCEIET